MGIEFKQPLLKKTPYLDGQFLIAMPGMSDDRFQRSLIYVCAHSNDGAMGIVINKPEPEARFAQLLVQLDVINEREAIRLPSRAEDIHVLKGGPVESGRGFVLHTPDYQTDGTTLAIADGVCMSVTLDILRAIADGQGPHKALFALGYTGWGAGQLEEEILHNGWLTCEGDPQLVFDMALETKYERALRKLGIDPAMLSSFAGHA
jgi:putative transcriptional regulator